MIVARDIVHAKLLERLNNEGKLPKYLEITQSIMLGQPKHQRGWRQARLATTAGRMDSYAPTFQAAGGSMVMLAKATGHV